MMLLIMIYEYIVDINITRNNKRLAKLTSQETVKEKQNIIF